MSHTETQQGRVVYMSPYALEEIEKKRLEMEKRLGFKPPITRAIEEIAREKKDENA